MAARSGVHGTGVAARGEEGVVVVGRVIVLLSVTLPVFVEAFRLPLDVLAVLEKLPATGANHFLVGDREAVAALFVSLSRPRLKNLTPDGVGARARTPVDQPALEAIEFPAIPSCVEFRFYGVAEWAVLLIVIAPFVPYSSAYLATSAGVNALVPVDVIVVDELLKLPALPIVELAADGVTW
nr:hypothetical protein [Rhodococcus corynebacterioides]